MEIRTCESPDCQRELPSGGRADQRFCSQACRLRAFRKRSFKRKLRSSYPETAATLAELYDHAGRPDHRAGIKRGEYDPDLIEHTDYHDVGVYEQDRQDDEQGIIGGDPGRYDPDSAWAERMAYTEAVDVIQARYERILAPYRETLKRNQGVKPTVVAKLEQARDAEIRGLTRAHQHAEALARAAREAPYRAVQAAERQTEYAALNAFGRDLPGGSRRHQEPDWSGRHTDDIAVW
jgi:hypothetical protein